MDVLTVAVDLVGRLVEQMPQATVWNLYRVENLGVIPTGRYEGCPLVSWEYLPDAAFLHVAVEVMA